MTQRRFFISPAAITENSASLTGQEVHHIRKVLRLTAGELITLFDGTGKVYTAKIESINRDTIRTAIIETTFFSETRPSLHFGLALLKGKKMDFLIQKATELGVSSIHPFLSQHSSVKPPPEEKENRWQRVALEACKQCNRPVPPDCHALTDFSSLVDTAEQFDLKLILWEQEELQSIDKLLSPESPPTSLMALVGPEGGFSVAEYNQATAAGFLPITLGRRTLRAETAGFAAMVILQYLLGNLK